MDQFIMSLYLQTLMVLLKVNMTMIIEYIEYIFKVKDKTV
jgi:hypothetical protein